MKKKKEKTKKQKKTNFYQRKKLDKSGLMEKGNIRSKK